MLKDAIIIFRKEAGNVFRDLPTVVANYLLPILMMPLVFGVIGFAQSAQSKSRAETVYQLCIVNSPGAAFEERLGKELKYQTGLERGSLEGVTVEFPEAWSPGTKATVRVLSDSTRQDIQFAAQKARDAILAYNQELSRAVLERAGLAPADLEILSLQNVDVAPPQAQGSGFLATMLPYLVLLLVFAGSMGLGMAITAGEKEKGTLASLLVNQVSRTSIALGKTLFLLMSSLISALGNALGIVVAVFIMGVWMAGSGGLDGAQAAQAAQAAGGGGAFNLVGGLVQPFNLVGFLTGLLLASGLAASAIVFLGTRARNMKEATGYIMPLYLVILMAGVGTMNMDTSANLGLYLIPLVNTVFLFKAAIVATLTPLNLLVTLLVNGAGIALFSWLTTKEFNSERVLYTE